MTKREKNIKLLTKIKDTAQEALDNIDFELSTNPGPHRREELYEAKVSFQRSVNFATKELKEILDTIELNFIELTTGQKTLGVLHGYMTEPPVVGEYLTFESNGRFRIHEVKPLDTKEGEMRRMDVFLISAPESQEQ